ncbi:hypothetical protein [Aliagarivorans marinus]|uniref:hypothetical protein n=1 Tax=Aliagarivorans marinus TaxID=561965 RepID=UPI0003F7D819|nr:hypothetical protein [Aliagarivorans marinus]
MPIIRFMCVQPIEINVEHYENLLSRSKQQYRSQSRFQDNPFASEWLQAFRQHHKKFINFRSLFSEQENKVDAKLLVQDLLEPRFKVAQQLNLAEYLQAEHCHYDLVFDPRFFNFVLLYELRFNIPENRLYQILSSDDETLKHDDFYNTVRRLLVQEEEDSILSRWGEKTRNHALHIVEELAGAARKDSQRKVASISTNTGNITVFVEADPQDRQCRQWFLDCNASAERVKNNRTLVVDNRDVTYAFHGRFHTIIALDPRYYLRFAPIQYHIQFIWYYVRYYSEVMEVLNNHVVALNSQARIDSKRHIIDEYINKIELLKMHNENIKLAIESDNIDIYAKIEAKWNIESSLNNAQSYVSFFKDYLERAYLRKAERANKRQNHILFVISCIQILGLISIWSDYLGLTDLPGRVTNGVAPAAMLAVIEVINTWMPVALFVSLIGLMAFAYMKRE